MVEDGCFARIVKSNNDHHVLFFVSPEAAHRARKNNKNNHSKKNDKAGTPSAAHSERSFENSKPIEFLCVFEWGAK